MSSDLGPKLQPCLGIASHQKHDERAGAGI